MIKYAISFFTVIIVTFLSSFHAFGTIAFYVDPDWQGTDSGTSTNPWATLTNSAWDIINNSLASDDVVVYFSAREADFDTPETTSIQLSVLRTDSGTNTLTLDGKSFYNTNDDSPSWCRNDPGTNPGFVRDGGNAFKISSGGSCIYSSGITTSKQSNIIITGFITENSGSGKCVAYWAGDHVTITDIFCSQTETATGGPNFYFQCILHDSDTVCPDGRDVSASCYPSTDIEWSYLKIDGGYGEGIYHCGCYTQTDSACLTGHSDVWIHHNIFKDASLRGKQGDGIETKPCVSGVVIEDNEIYWEDQNPISTDWTMAYGIIVNSSATIQRNFIHDYPGDGINLNENADDADGFRDVSETTIINNLIVNVGKRSIGSWKHGIHANYEAGDDDWNNVKIYNNTIFGGGGDGIRLEHPDGYNFSVYNNIVSNNSGIELNILNDSSPSHDNNIIYDTSGVVFKYDGVSLSYDDDISSFESHSYIDFPLSSSIESPYTIKEFMVEYDSVARRNGAIFSDFSNDILGAARSDGDDLWDIGAIEYFVTPPSGIVIK